MGKIKSRLIRRTANKLVDKGVAFTGRFEDNKKLLVGTIESKKIRNQTAGFLARMMSAGKKALKAQ
jgi:ribosomal protein S17E